MSMVKDFATMGVRKGRQGTRMIARVVMQYYALVAKRLVDPKLGRVYRTVVRAIRRHLVFPLMQDSLLRTARRSQWWI